MNADLDMNSQRILNLPSPASANEPLRLQDLTDFVGGTVDFPADAGSVTFTPFDTIEATNVQDAIEEVFNEGGNFSVIYSVSQGVVSDGVTDDTSAMNAIIADINSAGGNSVIVLPVGTTLCTGALTTITTPNVFIIGEGTERACVLKLTGAAGLVWNGASVDGGGLKNLTLQGDDGATDAAINLPRAVRMVFSDINIKDIGVLAYVGDNSGGTTSHEIYFDNLRGHCSNNSTAPLINALNGTGLFINNAEVFTDDVYSSVAVGRYFLAASQGSFDLIELNDCTLQTFYSPLAILASAGESNPEY